MQKTAEGGARSLAFEDFSPLGSLGKGGFGYVLSMESLKGPLTTRQPAVRLGNSRPLYALKVVKKGQSAGNDWHALHKERDLMNRLSVGSNNPSSSYTVQLYATFQNAYYAVFVMEQLACNLGDLLRQQRSLKDQHSKFYIGALYLAMEFLHSGGISHRDIKPENCVLTFGGRLKIIDFGLSTDFKDHSHSQTKFVGTPLYKSPEMMHRLQPSLLHGEDVWSFGVSAYEISAGSLPFLSYRDDVLAKAPRNAYRLDKDLRDLLLKRCLIVDRHKRIRSAEIRDHAYFRENYLDQLHSMTPPFRFSPESGLLRVSALQPEHKRVLLLPRNAETDSGFFKGFDSGVKVCTVKNTLVGVR